MFLYPEPILKLITSLSRLPGVGPKTAERLALHILHAPGREAQILSADILELKNRVRLCAVCFALSDDEKCRICSNSRRDQGVICVVENPTDMAAIEKSGGFQGVYHVLGGVLSALDGVGPGDIRLRELFSRARDHHIREVILATKTNVEGEATAAFIRENLKNAEVRLSRIASGIPMGSDLQYIDQLTMQKAIEKRYEC